MIIEMEFGVKRGVKNAALIIRSNCLNHHPFTDYSGN